MNAPFIASLGDPPDRHAERVVGEMIDWLHTTQFALRDRAIGVLDLRRMGHPKGQQRCVEAFKKAVGPLLLDYSLSTASRGRFRLGFTSWHVWNPTSGIAVPRHEPVPGNAQIAALVTRFRGRNYIPDWTTIPMLTVSRHACVRLAQRADVRTVSDLINSVGSIWDAFYTTLVQDKTTFSWLEPLNGQHCLPFWQDHPDSPVAVIKRIKGTHHMVVTTILTAEQAR